MATSSSTPIYTTLTDVTFHSGIWSPLAFPKGGAGQVASVERMLIWLVLRDPVRVMILGALSRSVVGVRFLAPYIARPIAHFPDPSGEGIRAV